MFGSHNMADKLLKVILDTNNPDIECTLFCNLQSQGQTHAILVIGLYELLGNPTT
jgi:hypothetical protein